MLSERRRAVLAALIDEYVSSAHPVPSKALVERYGLGCSPATVRTDLAALEETGYVYQPHISAGRVPTDVGYREYVDSMVGEPGGAHSPREAEAIRRFYATHELEVGDLMRQTASLLAAMTGYISVVVAPAVGRSRIKRVSLVAMGDRQVLLVVITDRGQVAKRFVEVAQPLTEEQLRDLEGFLSQSLDDKVAEEAGVLERELLRAPSSFRAAAATLVREIVDCMEEADDERVVHGGAAGLLKLPEFADPQRATPVLGMLEDGLAMLRTLTDIGGPGGTVVSIGHENAREELVFTSVVATDYGGRDSSGFVALIGPTRMDYGHAMSVTRCVAEELDEAL